MFPDVKFLNPAAPWSSLQYEAKNLGITELSVYGIYCHCSFPSSSKFDDKEKLEHLKFIGTKCFKGKIINHQAESTFTDTLKALKCIPYSSGVHEIGFFYDPTIYIIAFKLC